MLYSGKTIYKHCMYGHDIIGKQDIKTYTFKSRDQLVVLLSKFLGAFSRMMTQLIASFGWAFAIESGWIRIELMLYVCCNPAFHHMVALFMEIYIGK